MSEAERVVDRLNDVALVAGNRSMQTLIMLGVARDAVALIRSQQEELRRKDAALIGSSGLLKLWANSLDRAGSSNQAAALDEQIAENDRARDAMAEKKDGI